MRESAGDFVTRGWIDLHCHVFRGVGESVNADRVCLPHGTTTAIDGGTAGARTIDAFRELAATSRTRVLAWLNLASVGIVDARVGELIPGPYLDPDAAIEAARKHAGFVVGFKARLSTDACGGPATRILKVLREVADEAGLPAMVHVGNTVEPLAEIVEWLKPGDVVTHAFTGRNHGILDVDGRVFPEIVDARRRGVVFDAARGRNHLAFPVLKAAVEQGFLPDTLSTDMTLLSARDPDYGLQTLATYLLALGVPVEAIVERVTVRPAGVLGLDDALSGESDGAGDRTIVRIEEGAFETADVDGRRWRLDRRLRVVGAFRSGTYYPFGVS